MSAPANSNVRGRSGPLPMDLVTANAASTCNRLPMSTGAVITVVAVACLRSSGSAPATAAMANTTHDAR